MASTDAEITTRAESGYEGMARVESFEYHVTKFTRLQRPRIKTSSFTSLELRKHLLCDFDENLSEIMTRLENGGSTKTRGDRGPLPRPPLPLLRSRVKYHTRSGEAVGASCLEKRGCRDLGHMCQCEDTCEN